MSIFDFFKKHQKKENENNEFVNENISKDIDETVKNKKEINKETKEDKSFHPEILFFINKDDAEYVDFEEA